MEKKILYVVLVATLSCSPPQKETAAIDSTSTAKDTVAVTVPTTPTAPAANPVPNEPQIDPRIELGFRYEFPEYSKKIFTKDQSEITITKAVTALLDQYSSEKFITIKRRSGPLEYETLGEATTGTWYFNVEGELKAYYQLRQQNIMSISNLVSYRTIYLFQDSLIIACYSDNEDRAAEPGVSWVRYLTSQYPQCGVHVYGDDYAEYLKAADYEVKPLYPLNIANDSEMFFTEYEKLLTTIREAETPEMKDDEYFLVVEKDYFDRPYTVEYSIHPTLYEKITTSP